jgi:CheY-like chemotaxis protein
VGSAGNRISLVLLDMTMPVMSGEETLAKLRTLCPSVKVIASSGYNEIEALRRFYRATQLVEEVKPTFA